MLSIYWTCQRESPCSHPALSYVCSLFTALIGSSSGLGVGQALGLFCCVPLLFSPQAVHCFPTASEASAVSALSSAEGNTLKANTGWHSAGSFCATWIFKEKLPKSFMCDAIIFLWHYNVSAASAKLRFKSLLNSAAVFPTGSNLMRNFSSIPLFFQPAAPKAWN